MPLSTITTLITMDAAMVLISSLFAGLDRSVGRKWMMVIGSAVNGLHTFSWVRRIPTGRSPC